MDKYSKNDYIILPTPINNTFLIDPSVGVFLLACDNKNRIWHGEQFMNTKHNKKRLSGLIFKNQYNDFEYNMVVINQNGQICYSNCKAEVSKDENGYIHINDNEYLVKVIEDKDFSLYIGGKDINELNNRASYAIYQKTIQCPKDFTAKGFKTQPIYESQK